MHRNVVAFLAAEADLGVTVEPREFPDSTHTPPTPQPRSASSWGPS